jgi:hypothetical protein
MVGSTGEGIQLMDAATLAALAGNALVTAAVTDVWEDVRHKIARLFGRGQPDSQIERRLDATREQLAATDPDELEGAQVIQAAQWTTRFGDLLADHPEADAELRALVAEIQAAVPVTATDHSVAAGRDLSVQADRGGVAAAVIHGDVTSGPTGPGPASS